MTEPKRIGRPSSFTQETADKICERLAMGESLRSITKEKAMPNQVTVYRWLRANPTFRKSYTQAREDQADTHADMVLDIASGVEGRRTVTRTDKDGKKVEVVIDEDPSRSRLRMDAHRWHAGKVRPSKYGDKMTIDHNHNFADIPSSELVQMCRGMCEKLGIELPEAFGDDLIEKEKSDEA